MKRSLEPCESIFICFLVFVLGFVVGAGLGEYEVNYEKKQAVKAGVAEYRVDKNTGVTTFWYIKRQEDESKVIKIPTETR